MGRACDACLSPVYFAIPVDSRPRRLLSSALILGPIALLKQIGERIITYQARTSAPAHASSS
jgi:hypothetical protein